MAVHPLRPATDRRLGRKKDSFYVVDRDSLNHTFLEGRKLPPKKYVKLESGQSFVPADEEFTFYYEASYHKKGVGRALIDYVGKYVLLEEGFHRLTVNAAPYAVGFYHKLGFRDTDIEKTNDGIRYTPMEKTLV